MDFLDEIDPQATEVGAVNTVKVHPNGRLSGHNSDVYGFRQALVPFLEPHHERALILGTGGASDAVAYVLRHLGIEYYFVSRQKREGRYLTYGELTEVHVRNCPLIVNATPLGTFPHVDTCPDIPYDGLDERNLLFDLVYNPPDTLFMKKAGNTGLRYAAGRPCWNCKPKNPGRSGNNAARHSQTETHVFICLCARLFVSLSILHIGLFYSV